MSGLDAERLSTFLHYAIVIISMRTRDPLFRAWAVMDAMAAPRHSLIALRLNPMTPIAGTATQPCGWRIAKIKPVTTPDNAQGRNLRR